jgi:hypothetical protein
MVPRYRPGHARSEKEDRRLTPAESARVRDALGRIAEAREALDDAHAWLVVTVRREKHERVRRAFAKFMDAGGVTADDWLRFVAGGRQRGCPRHKKHMRLVVDHGKRRPPRGRDTGPDAA